MPLQALTTPSAKQLETDGLSDAAYDDFDIIYIMYNEKKVKTVRTGMASCFGIYQAFLSIYGNA